MQKTIQLKIQSIVFWGLSGIMVGVTLISFLSAFSWIHQPFPGFLSFQFPRVGNFSSNAWSGPQAGIRYWDRIAEVDGRIPRSGQDVIDAVRQKEPGAPVNYVIESKGEKRQVTLPVNVFGVTDFLLVFFVMFLGGFLVYCLGFVVYVLKPNVLTSWIFFFFCFSLGSYMVTGFTAQASYRFVHLNYFIAPFVPACLFHLCLIFPEKKRLLLRIPKIEYLIYLPALLCIISLQAIILNLYPEGNAPWIFRENTANTANRIFFLSGIGGSIILLIHSFFKATTIIVRQRARMILLGVSFALFPPVILMLMTAALGANFPWNFLVFFVILFPASIGYSIVRHNLFDADAIIRRTVGYVASTAVVVGAYVGVSVLLNVFVSKYQLAQSRTFPILFTLAVILIFNPLRDRIQTLVDRIFFRKEYDYGTIVEKVSGAMTSLLDLRQILKHLTQTFIEDMFINTSSVMLLTQDGDKYQVYLADGERKHDVEQKMIKRDEPLMEILEEDKKELTKYDVVEDPRFREVSEPCAANFEALHASLMVPLVYQNQVIGSLNLGEKKSGKFYNREDIDLLRTLAHQGAVAIENARLFQENLEKQRMEEELNIARELQMSMLPSVTPEIKGFEIAAYCVSAREVGGDFYDFIDMGEEKAGIVIGDVTGKSVSGALVMSSSRSIFRMLSEDELTVAESMMRANRRIKKDIKTGMFVALLYVVLNSQDRSLTLCSAGQTQPVHFSAKEGEATLVETQGDTFPLGILEDASYEDTQLQLEPGDRVIFYTDGIVEAMNDQEEMFGFERLLDVVKAVQSKNVDSVLKEILDRVNEFVGGAEQHDDLTVIILDVTE